MNGRSCGECEFYTENPGLATGVCRRYPPTPFPVGAVPRGGIMDPKNPSGAINVIVHQAFPNVTAADWCGEFVRRWALNLPASQQFQTPEQQVTNASS